MPELTDYLINITRRVLGPDSAPITHSTHFADDLNADSLECLDLMMALEEAFDVEFEDDDLPELTTVSAVANYLEARAGDSPAVRSLLAA